MSAPALPVGQEACPGCGAGPCPVVLWEPAAVLANSPQGLPLELRHCPDCGLVFQASAYASDYDPVMAQVYADYLKSEQFPFPRRSAENLASLEFVLAGLAGKEAPRVLEIGSNRGDFLFLLKERLPRASVLGVEPSRQENLRVPTLRGRFEPEMFSSRFDLVIMQHVLEHIKHPLAFTRGLGQVLADDGLLFLEVPDLGNSLAQGVEDFCLEHVNYFSPASLARCLPGLSLAACDQSSFLRSLWQRQGPGLAIPPGPNQAAVTDGLARYAQNKRDLIQRIAAHQRSGGRVVFYGAAYYFRMVHRCLAPELAGDKGLYFHDDQVASAREPAFGLPRLEAWGPDCLAVLCSNNFRVQEAMAARLAGLELAGVVRPWLAGCAPGRA